MEAAMQGGLPSPACPFPDPGALGDRDTSPHATPSPKRRLFVTWSAGGKHPFPKPTSHPGPKVPAGLAGGWAEPYPVPALSWAWSLPWRGAVAWLQGLADHPVRPALCSRYQRQACCSLSILTLSGGREQRGTVELGCSLCWPILVRKSCGEERSGEGIKRGETGSTGCAWAGNTLIRGNQGEKRGQPTAPSKAIKLRAAVLITHPEKKPTQTLRCFQTAFLQMPVWSDDF